MAFLSKNGLDLFVRWSSSEKGHKLKRTLRSHGPENLLGLNVFGCVLEGPGSMPEPILSSPSSACLTVICFPC